MVPAAELVDPTPAQGLRALASPTTPARPAVARARTGAAPPTDTAIVAMLEPDETPAGPNRSLHVAPLPPTPSLSHTEPPMMVVGVPDPQRYRALVRTIIHQQEVCVHSAHCRWPRARGRLTWAPRAAYCGRTSGPTCTVCARRCRSCAALCWCTCTRRTAPRTTTRSPTTRLSPKVKHHPGPMPARPPDADTTTTAVVAGAAPGTGGICVCVCVCACMRVCRLASQVRGRARHTAGAAQ
jgi:hypothetical protein